MRQPTDDELVLHYYGESPDPAEMNRLIEGSPELRERFAELRRILDAVEEPPIPEPSPFFESRVWNRLEAEVGGATGSRVGRLRGWLAPRREWGLVGAMALLLVLSFAAGRFWPRDEVTISTASLERIRERILLVTVAGHLERSETLLVELANAQGNGVYDLSAERALATELKGSNRLYRQSALQAGQPELAALLEDLELVLLELAHGPGEVPSEDLGALRLQVDESDLLFKVRVVGSRLRQETRTDIRPAIDRGAGRDA